MQKQYDKSYLENTQNVYNPLAWSAYRDKNIIFSMFVFVLKAPITARGRFVDFTQHLDSVWSLEHQNTHKKTYRCTCVGSGAQNWCIWCFYLARHGTGVQKANECHCATPPIRRIDVSRLHSQPGGTWTSMPRLPELRVNVPCSWINLASGWGVDGVGVSVPNIV